MQRIDALSARWVKDVALKSIAPVIDVANCIADEAEGFSAEKLFRLSNGEVLDAVMDVGLTIGVRLEDGVVCVENEVRGPVAVGVHDELEPAFEPGIHEGVKLSGALIVLRSAGVGP